MKTTVLNLEPHDDLISIRDKMAWAKSPRILLVWPRRRRRNAEAPLYLSRLELTLLLRQAKQLGAQLALVTANAQVRAYAAEVGLPVFETAEEAQGEAWRRRRGRGRIRRSAPRVDLRITRQKLPERTGAGLKKSWLRVAVFGVGILAVISVLMILMPGATVRLSPAVRSQQVRLEVWGSPEVQQALVTGALPVRSDQVVVEGQQQISASGSVLIPDNYAVGQVLFTNQTTSALILPAGTVLRTLDTAPVRFELIEGVHLPAGVGLLAQGSVRALLPGPQGNVASGTVQSVEGTLGALVAVTNPQAFSGGSQQLAPAPTAKDYADLRQMLLESLRHTAIEELSGRLSDGELLISDSLQIERIELEQRTPPEGGAADVLILTLRAEFSIWVVQESDLENVGRMALDATMPQGFRAVEEKPHYQLEHDFNMQGARAVGVLSANWQVESSLSAWELAQRISGLNPQEASQVLQTSLELSEPPSIEINPPWWPAMPFLPARILVIIGGS